MSVEFDREPPGKFDSRTLSRETLSRWTGRSTANLPTRILDFRGFHSSRILNLRGGILRSIGKFP